MGIYETLYAFQKAFGTSMGEPGTHPWSQGFPRTDQLPGGPPLPQQVAVSSDHLRYPKAWGMPALREALAGYYRRHYGARLTADNVMVFAGGRPALAAVLMFLHPEVAVRVASTEYTPYHDMLKLLGRRRELVASTAGNRFRPDVDDLIGPGPGPTLLLMSNPCNPTGVTRSGDELARLVRAAESGPIGLLIDEAYEMFHDPPVSALAHVSDIDDSNLFVAGAATKGLQAPGIRVGWLVASRRHIEILGNFSSFGMGGVSHPSQCYALALLEEERVARARAAVSAYYRSQRERYGEALASLGLELHTGTGGFYHWCRLPDGLAAAELNRRLFVQGAAVLKGTDCDMARGGESPGASAEASPLRSFFRFSFGPLQPASFHDDVRILREALASS
jgi:aspartate/methionine/tyrosine aminotransferase